MTDQDVRAAIVTALTNTGGFDAVVLWGLPEEYGTGASNMALAVLSPKSFAQRRRVG